jgi:hypothetical protein
MNRTVALFLENRILTEIILRYIAVLAPPLTMKDTPLHAILGLIITDVRDPPRLDENLLVIMTAVILMNREYAMIMENLGIELKLIHTTVPRHLETI